MNENRIAEVRGVAKQQNLDAYIGDVLDLKLKEFKDAKNYLKKEHDMKLLTTIHTKLLVDPDASLTKEEARFLYEIDSPIKGFGYEDDPRIEECMNLRINKQMEDYASAYECRQDQIVFNIDNINIETKVYIGDETEIGITEEILKSKPWIDRKAKELNLKCDLTDLPKHIIDELETWESTIVTNDIYFNASNLTTCWKIEANAARYIGLPKLKKSGQILAKSAKDITIPELEKAEMVYIPDCEKLEAPKLIETELINTNAVEVILPTLQKINILHIWHATYLEIPHLATATDIRAPEVLGFDAPELKSTNEMNIVGAIRVDLPSLERADKLKMSSCENAVLPSLITAKMINAEAALSFSATKMTTTETLNLNMAVDIYLPSLTHAQDIYAYSCTKFELPELEKCEDLWLTQANTIIMPKLTEVETININDLTIKSLQIQQSISDKVKHSS